MNRKIATSFLALPIAALLLLPACSTTETVPPKAVHNLDIRKGSPTSDLIAALGEPLSIAPLEVDPENAEVWTYRVEKSRTELISTRTEEIPFVDPITGEMKSVSEPYYSPQTTTHTDVILVYVANDTVLGWHVNRKENRTISD